MPSPYSVSSDGKVKITSLILLRRGALSMGVGFKGGVKDKLKIRIEWARDGAGGRLLKGFGGGGVM